jgi:hypothetical protein
MVSQDLLLYQLPTWTAQMDTGAPRDYHRFGGLYDIMHPQHQILRVLRRLVTVSRLRLRCSWRALGTTEAASQARQWCGEAGRRSGRFGAFWAGRDDLRR